MFQLIIENAKQGTYQIDINSNKPTFYAYIININ